MAITTTGILMRDNPKTFTLVYEEIEIGDIIGRGSSSVVLRGYHAPTETPLALKVMVDVSYLMNFNLRCVGY